MSIARCSVTGLRLASAMRPVVRRFSLMATVLLPAMMPMPAPMTEPAAAQSAPTKSSCDMQVPPGSSAERIRAAIESARDGDTVCTAPNEIVEVGETIEINLAGRHLTLDGRGATFRQTSDVTVFEASDSYAGLTGASLNCASQTISFDEIPSHLVAGSWVKIVSDSALPGPVTLYKGAPSKSKRLGQIVQIASIDGNAAVWKGTLLDCSSYADNVRAAKVGSGALTMRNLTVQGGAKTNPDWNETLVELHSQVGGRVERVRLRDGGGVGLNIISSIATVEALDVRHLTNDAAEKHFGYGIHLQGGGSVLAEGVYCEDTRHCFDGNAPSVKPGSQQLDGYGAALSFTGRDSLCWENSDSCWSTHAESRLTLYERLFALKSRRFGIARGDRNTWRDSVGIGLGRIDAWGHQWNASDSQGVQNSLLDRVVIREVYHNASYGGPPTITGNTVANSRLESYGTNATGGEGVAYVDDTIVAKVGSDADVWDTAPAVTEGADLLFSGLGDDTVSAKGGDDLIMGGPGNDVLTGGGGRDRFLYIGPDEGVDTITDFAPGKDGDIIDVSFFLARFAGADYGGDPFADGYVRLVQSGSDSLLQLDADGGGRAYTTVAVLRDVRAATLTDENWRLHLTQ